MINLVAGSVANSVFFYVYTDGKIRYNYDPNNPNTLTTILISMRASLAGVVVTTPMWILKTRLVLYKEKHGVKVI
jgi:hypothetical protein